MKTLTVFAGPNGSGKTTITNRFLEESSVELGHYLNPDDIEQQLTFHGLAYIGIYEIHPSQADWLDFLQSSTLAAKISRDSGLLQEQLVHAIRLNEVEGVIEPVSSAVSDDYMRLLLLTLFARCLFLASCHSRLKP
ncbi:hypothetical protein GCM10023187_06050 [Nibrella viscosa]|uniref:UDP-N-acetylglucosamine kinase n=1 Tax=Nibrella viscosa TaxID=1084524 RepID=A0ABP8JWM6_9BACT